MLEKAKFPFSYSRNQISLPAELACCILDIDSMLL